MLVARDSVGTRVEASRHTAVGEYFCPTCGSPVVAKPGRVVIPHFAHIATSNCPSARESLDHLRAKKVLAEKFRAVGYEVALEEPHPLERRVDVAVTVPHPLRPLRYSVEVQNSAIDPREMFRRLLADIEAGFWYTAWVFTGARAAPLLAADVGSEVRVSADVLAEEHIVAFPERETSRRQLTELLGTDPNRWMSERLAAGSYGCLGRLYGVKCLDSNGQMWNMQFDKVARYNSRTAGGNGAPLRSTRRISQKRTVSFDLFGSVWGPGDQQRLDLATGLAESLTSAATPIRLDELHQFAAQVLDTPRTTAFDEWVDSTLQNITNFPLRPSLTDRDIKREAGIFVESIRESMNGPTCGWPAAPQIRCVPARLPTPDQSNLRSNRDATREV